MRAEFGDLRGVTGNFFFAPMVRDRIPDLPSKT